MQTFIASGKEVTLYSVSGTIASGIDKRGETIIRGSGGGGYMHNGSGHTTPVQIRSTTIIHDQFFLVDNAGKEHAFQLVDFNLACREGHQLKVIWAIAKGKANGPYVAVQNFTTGDYFFQEKKLKELLTPSAFYCIGALAILFFITNATSGGFTAFMVVSIGFIISGVVYNSIAKSNVAAFKAFMKNGTDS